ncbi:MAG TPA: hypothetical protein VFO01_10530 [Trebonia sp.]|nr:hypothetical protein [Trebonia sp.]
MTDHSAATVAGTAPAPGPTLEPDAIGAVDFVTVGLLPLGAAGFLGWIFVKSLGEAPWSQRWSLIGIVIAGLVVVFSARFILRSSFFRLPPGE